METTSSSGGGGGNSGGKSNDGDKNFKNKLVQYTDDAPDLTPAIVHTYGKMRKNRALTEYQINQSSVNKTLIELEYTTEIKNCSQRIANHLIDDETPIFTATEYIDILRLNSEFKSAYPRHKLNVKNKSLPNNYITAMICIHKGWFRRARTFKLMKDRCTLESADREFMPVASLLQWFHRRNI